jgi:hypothetical protein
MTTIFSDGFESGDFSAWTSITGSPTVSSAQKHHGSYSEYVNAIGKYAAKTFTASSITYARCYVYFNTLPGTGNKAIWLLQVKGGNSEVDVFIQNNIFYLRSYQSNPSVLSDVSSGVSAVAGQWYCVEIKFNYTNHLQELWIDGVSKAQDTCNLNNNPASVWAGSSWGEYTPTVDYFIDCVVVSDSYVGPEATSALKTVTDALSLNDILLRNKILKVTENVGVTDALAGRNKSPLRMFDSVGLVDLARRNKKLKVSDALQANDTAILPSRVLKALDSVGVRDGFAVQKTLFVSEAVCLVELVEAGAAGGRRTRLFLVLGDLAIQLSGDN